VNKCLDIKITHKPLAQEHKPEYLDNEIKYSI
jgi:hypothetical protein